VEGREVEEMRYEEFETVGEYSKSKTYEGTPQEIHELLKLKEEKKKSPVKNVFIDPSYKFATVEDVKTIYDATIEHIHDGGFFKHKAD
jgi:16S rRNA G966 N2-methylase RsmD